MPESILTPPTDNEVLSELIEKLIWIRDHSPREGDFPLLRLTIANFYEHGQREASNGE